MFTTFISSFVDFFDIKAALKSFNLHGSIEMKLKALSFLAAGVMTLSAHQAAAETVDLELALLVDVSGSISTSEFNLQRQGYVNAFSSAAIYNKIQGGAIGSIAATLIYWSGENEQAQAVGWTKISDQASSLAFANAIGAAGRPYSGLTAPGSAISFAQPLFDNNGFEGTRLVMDVSGDGQQNDGSSTAAARDAAAGAGITINGLPIGGTGLSTWYAANVVTADGFLVSANGFADFESALNDKLIREIAPQIPLPAPALLLMSGLFGLGLLRNRRKTA